MDDTPPYIFEELADTDKSLVIQNFGSESLCNDLVRLVDRASKRHITTLNRSYKQHHHLVYNMKVRKDDVWVVTYPKCGTTWTQEMTWNIMNGVKIDKISEKLFDRSPFIDLPMIENQTLEEAQEFFSKIEAMPSPRTIKSHYPFELLPPHLLDTCKVIFVCRNVKDACVSYFHHNRLFKSFCFDSSFDIFSQELYRKSNALQGGYFEMLESGWKRKNHPNLLFFWYEEMKQDQRHWMIRIMKHIGYDLEKEKIDELCGALKFDNYQKTCSMNQDIMGDRFNADRGEFIRKGIIGDWVNHFNKDIADDWDLWIKENFVAIGIDDLRVKDFFQLNCFPC